MGQLQQSRPLSPDDVPHAQHAAKAFADLLKLHARALLEISPEVPAAPKGKTKRPGPKLRQLPSEHVRVTLPREALQLFTRILSHMANGIPVTIVPIDAELTTQQAADILNVSRPYLVKLIEEEKIPCRKVGARRRIRHSDLLAFKQRDDAERRRVAAELVENAEELGLDY